MTKGARIALGVGAFCLAALVCSLPRDRRLRTRATRAAMGVAGAAGTALLLARRREVERSLRSFLVQPRDPLDLAVFRIVVAWQILDSIWPSLVRSWAEVPRELQFPPETGLPRRGPLASLARWPVLPFHRLPMETMLVGLRLATIAMLIGLFSRTSSAVAGALFTVVFGSLQWHGKVDHVHHLVWFAALLAASRSGDALSVDAIVRAARGRGIPAPSAAYGTPLAYAMLLFGPIYFFPGVWKLWRSGVDWFLGDNLRYTIFRERAVIGGWKSPFPIERWPALYRSAGAATILFETGFVFLLFDRRTRFAAVTASLAFHAFSRATAGIIFTSLVWSHVAFVEWGALVRRLARQPREAEAARPPAAVVTVGTILVAGAVITGARRAMQAWPFAAYPMFDGIQGPTNRSLEVEVLGSDGVTAQIALSDLRTRFGHRWIGTLSQVLAEAEPKRGRLEALWSLISADDPALAGARRVRFLRVERWLQPERSEDQPVGTETLLEWEPNGRPVAP